MNCKDAVFVFRDDLDDFTLWTVALPEDMIFEIKFGDRVAGNDVRSLLWEMPALSENSENRLTLLATEDGAPVLYTKNMPYDFFMAHCHQGYSVRGSLENILDELAEQELTAASMNMEFN